MTNSIFSLEGRTALVTGSSQGIGLSLATGLAEAGAKVILNGRDSEKLATTAERLASEGHYVAQLSFDVTDHAAVRRAVDEYEAAEGPIDILVNNAGMQHRAPLEDFPEDAFDRLMRTNVTSVFNVGQACARHMIARGEGKVVNIASIQAALARQTIAPYTASKGAVANLTKGMAADWAQHNIQVNAIAPGYFDTPLNAALVADEEFTAWIGRRTPAGRWGQLPELRGACVFLCSAASSYVNGQTLFVDGGMSVTL
ncbi:SDR family oxidoreductase [Pelagovum pacificum]|uniref:Glucose 1-dehydrogenase n=1 Tax=Pelagovum pacificum TaxID=2588711 RepID=A0A5C5GGG0_9RHOB|nr:SDR family oxidoreductase [Pelagovum pacificum]QQA43017.1 glucose 1-dehydrogenase [Pelagovum pacificum]TNY33838.1 glucose 1-dehydrogenase [Pelagovum pacificum]